MIEELSIRTTAREQFVEVTERLQRIVDRFGLAEGMCHVFVPHTTAGITINERADPDVAVDILDALCRMVPTNGPWRHAEGNSPAHVKASLVGAGQAVWIVDGKLDLGVWQGIFFCEFDGPRTRRICVRISS